MLNVNHIKQMINVTEVKIQKWNNVTGMKKLIPVKFGLNVHNNNRLHIVNIAELVIGMDHVNKYFVPH